MNIRPLFDRVLVERQEEPTKTRGGLFLPESAKEKPMQGKILAAGEGRVADDGKITPLQVKVGDLVAFGKYAGTEIQLDGEERLILREEDILGIIESD
jgi:chaperonin GroES